MNSIKYIYKITKNKLTMSNNYLLQNLKEKLVFML